MPENMGAERAAASSNNNNSIGHSDSDNDRAAEARAQATIADNISNEPTALDRLSSEQTTAEKLSDTSSLDALDNIALSNSLYSGVPGQFGNPVTTQEIQDYLAGADTANADSYVAQNTQEACMAGCHGNGPPDPNRIDVTDEFIDVAKAAGETALGFTGLGGTVLGIKDFVDSPSMLAAAGIIPGARTAKSANKLDDALDALGDISNNKITKDVVTDGGTLTRGGKHTDVQGIPGNESHHLTADAVSPLTKGSGPAISMKKADHYQTGSWGSGKKADKFRDDQQKLIDEGKPEAAQQLGIKDVRDKFGSEYDEAIEQAVEYSKTIDLSGKKP